MRHKRPKGRKKCPRCFRLIWPTEDGRWPEHGALLTSWYSCEASGQLIKPRKQHASQATTEQHVAAQQSLQIAPSDVLGINVEG